eukprot:scaffold42355_cov62-Phaeocystis_antarctica.AAC.2
MATCGSCGIQPSSSESVASESGGVSLSPTGAGGCDMDPVVLESESSPKRLPKTCACTSSACVMLASSTRAGASPSAGGRGVSPCSCSAVTVSPRASASDEGGCAAAVGEAGAPAGDRSSGAAAVLEDIGHPTRALPQHVVLTRPSKL